MNSGPRLSRTLISLCLLALASLSAQSQDNSRRNPQGESRIQLRFSSFGDIGENTRFALRPLNVENPDSQRSEAFEIPTHGFGPPVSVNSRSLELGLPYPAHSTGAASTFQPLIPISLPPQGQAFLVLLLPPQEPGLGTTIQVIRADDPAFGAGDIQFINLGAARLAWRLGTETGYMDAYARQKVILPAPQDGRRNYPVEFYFESADGARRFSSSRWLYTPHVRTFVFFFPIAETGSYRYRVIEESPHWIDG